MYPFQEKLVNNFHDNRFNTVRCLVADWKSTTVVSYLLHYAVFNDSVNIGILANKASQRKGTARQITNCIREFTQVDAAGYNSMEQRILGAGKWSKILLLRLSAVRDMSFNILFDEFAFVPNHIADSFFASVYPTITSGQSTKVIIVSPTRYESFLPYVV